MGETMDEIPLLSLHRVSGMSEVTLSAPSRVLEVIGMAFTSDSLEFEGVR